MECVEHQNSAIALMNDCFEKGISKYDGLIGKGYVHHVDGSCIIEFDSFEDLKMYDRVSSELGHICHGAFEESKSPLLGFSSQDIQESITYKEKFRRFQDSQFSPVILLSRLPVKYLRGRRTPLKGLLREKIKYCAGGGSAPSMRRCSDESPSYSIHLSEAESTCTSSYSGSSNSRRKKSETRGLSQLRGADVVLTSKPHDKATGLQLTEVVEERGDNFLDGFNCDDGCMCPKVQCEPDFTKFDIGQVKRYQPFYKVSAFIQKFESSPRRHELEVHPSCYHADNLPSHIHESALKRESKRKIIALTTKIKPISSFQRIDTCSIPYIIKCDLQNSCRSCENLNTCARANKRFGLYFVLTVGRGRSLSRQVVESVQGEDPCRISEACAYIAASVVEKRLTTILVLAKESVVEEIFPGSLSTFLRERAQETRIERKKCLSGSSSPHVSVAQNKRELATNVTAKVENLSKNLNVTLENKGSESELDGSFVYDKSKTIATKRSAGVICLSKDGGNEDEHPPFKKPTVHVMINPESIPLGLKENVPSYSYRPPNRTSSSARKSKGCTVCKPASSQPARFSSVRNTVQGARIKWGGCRPNRQGTRRSTCISPVEGVMGVSETPNSPSVRPSILKCEVVRDSEPVFKVPIVASLIKEKADQGREVFNHVNQKMEGLPVNTHSYESVHLENLQMLKSVGNAAKANCLMTPEPASSGHEVTKKSVSNLNIEIHNSFIDRDSKSYAHHLVACPSSSRYNAHVSSSSPESISADLTGCDGDDFIDLTIEDLDVQKRISLHKREHHNESSLQPQDDSGATLGTRIPGWGVICTSLPELGFVKVEKKAQQLRLYDTAVVSGPLEFANIKELKKFLNSHLAYLSIPYRNESLDWIVVTAGFLKVKNVPPTHSQFWLNPKNDKLSLDKSRNWSSNIGSRAKKANVVPTSNLAKTVLPLVRQPKNPKVKVGSRKFPCASSDKFTVIDSQNTVEHHRKHVTSTLFKFHEPAREVEGRLCVSIPSSVSNTNRLVSDQISINTAMLPPASDSENLGLLPPEKKMVTSPACANPTVHSVCSVAVPVTAVSMTIVPGLTPIKQNPAQSSSSWASTKTVAAPLMTISKFKKPKLFSGSSAQKTQLMMPISNIATYSSTAVVSSSTCSSPPRETVMSTGLCSKSYITIPTSFSFIQKHGSAINAFYNARHPACPKPVLILPKGFKANISVLNTSRF